MGCERHAVAQVDTGASWLLALGRFRSAWPLHPLTSRSSSCHRMAGACSAKVLVATADRRVVSRPRVRQSAAPSRHQLLPARGARGACKWRVSAGRRCSDVAHSSPASASSVLDLEPRLRSSVSSTKRDSRARVAGGDGLRATCSCAGRYRSQLAPGARSIPVGMAAASAHQPQL